MNGVVCRPDRLHFLNAERSETAQPLVSPRITVKGHFRGSWKSLTNALPDILAFQSDILEGLEYGELLVTCSGNCCGEWTLRKSAI
jgi:hypothetical protein